MRTKLKNTNEVYHVWAQQSQEQGECQSCSFRGPAAFSYAAEIGRIHGDAVLLSTGSWSVTTAKHQGYAAGASSHYHQLHVDNTNPQNRTDHRANLDGLFRDARELADKQKRAKKYNYLDDIRRLLANVEFYCEHFKCKGSLRKSEKELLALDGDDQLAAVGVQAEQERSRVKKAEAARTKKEAKQSAANLEEWRNGGAMLRPFPNGQVYLRVKGDRLETSKHAEIPLSEAKRLWPAVVASHNGQTDIELPERIARHYAITSIQAGRLVVGCHTVEFAESERIARQLGLTS